MYMYVKLLIGCVLLVGCSSKSDLERVVVSGKVRYQGQPVNQGSIMLIPTQGTKGLTSAATIENGTYEVKASSGVPIGTHRVEIQGTRLTGEPKPERFQHIDAIPDPVEQYLPEKYNTKSELTLTVESRSQMTQDFELE